MRSATEELETGREELQSINEEISTINQELKGKVEQLGRANSDLQNLMASTRIATIFLDRNLRIKGFTPSSIGLFNFIPADIGRPLSDVTHRLQYPGIIADAENVLEHLTPVENEVRDSEGRWFLARQLPYRTTEDQIAGVVLTCIDITACKQAEEAREWLSDIVESSNDAIFSFNMDGCIVSWNHGAEEIFGFTAGEIKDKQHALLAPPGRQDEIREMMERLRRGDRVPEFDTVRLRKNGQPVDVSLSASVMINKGGDIVGATVIAQEITKRKLAVEQLRQARDELEIRVRERTAELNERANQVSAMAAELTTAEQRERQRLAGVLHDQLQQVLVSAKMMLETDAGDGGNGERDRCVIGLIDEALANSRTLTVELSPPALTEGLGPALNWLCEYWVKEKFGLQVKRKIDPTIDAADTSVRNLIFLGVRELLFNVVKHSETLEAEVTLTTCGPDQLELTVRDHGLGFDSTNHDKSTCSGLATLTQRLALLGGSFELNGKPKEGVQATIRAPRAALPNEE